MLVSRNSLQSYPQLQGADNPNFFTTRTERNNYYSLDTLVAGQYCAIGGNPNSEDWTVPEWEVEQYNGVNWTLITIDPNYALVITNDGLKALTDVALKGYKLTLAAVKIKANPIPANSSVINWTANDFEKQGDIVLDTTDSLNNTFTLNQNVSYRINLANGGIQYCIILDTNTMGKIGNQYQAEYTIGAIGLYVTNPNNPANLVLLGVANLSQTINKYANTPTRAGNALKFYLNTTLTNMGYVTDVNILPESATSIPEVVSDSELAFAYNGIGAPHNIYLVDNFQNTNVPALAVRTGNPVNDDLTWTYFSPTDDTIKIDNPDLLANIKDYMVVSWDGSKYIPTDGDSNNRVAGIKIGQSIIFAGNVVNKVYPYTYTYTWLEQGCSQGKNYRIGDTLSYIYKKDDVNIEFIFRVTDVNASGSILQMLMTPSEGYVGDIETELISPLPLTSQNSVVGEGLIIKISSQPVTTSSVIWDFPSSWVNKPLYADTNPSKQGSSDGRGLLTTTETVAFVGWCTSTNSIKLALDLDSEATYTKKGVVRYATNAEVSNVKGNTDAAEDSVICPKTLQDNYIQKNAVTGNPGESLNNPINVSSVLKFSSPIYGKGVDLTAISQVDPTIANSVSF